MEGYFVPKERKGIDEDWNHRGANLEMRAEDAGIFECQTSASASLILSADDTEVTPSLKMNDDDGNKDRTFE